MTLLFVGKANYSYVVTVYRFCQQYNRKEGNLYLTTHSTHFTYGYMTSDIMANDHSDSQRGRKEGNVLFNDALNTFYLRLYCVIHMVKDNSEMERGNPLPPHGLLFPISSKGSFICIIPQTG